MNKLISNNYSTLHCWEQWLAALRWNLWMGFVPLAIFQRMSERGYWWRERTPVRSWPIESRSYWRELPGRRSCSRDMRETWPNSGERLHTLLPLYSCSRSKQLILIPVIALAWIVIKFNITITNRTFSIFNKK